VKFSAFEPAHWKRALAMPEALVRVVKFMITASPVADVVSPKPSTSSWTHEPFGAGVAPLPAYPAQRGAVRKFEPQ
jgi:hypothetical protein